MYNKNEADISAMIGERITAIYFPVWALCYEVNNEKKTVFVDALAKRGYYQSEGFFEYYGDPISETNSQFVKPNRHQCPNCGDDLHEDHFSLFYPCRNCRRAYLLNNAGGYQQINIRVADSSICAPFWRFPLVISGSRHIETVADFSKLLGSEIALLKKEKQNNKFYLFSPAFKSSDVRNWFNKAYSMLITQPHHKLSDKMPQKYLPFNIDHNEAKQMAIFLWRKLVMKYSWGFPELQHLDESYLPDGEIVWLPAQNYALINKAVGFKEVNVVD
jgi:ribosomal protein L37AE/L43A